LAALGLLLLGAAIIQERRASDPMLPPRLFRNPTFIVANLTTLICSLGSSVPRFSSQFLSSRLWHDGESLGVAIMPFLLLWTIFSLATGRRIAATGRYRLLPPAGLALTVIAMLGLRPSRRRRPYGWRSAVSAFSASAPHRFSM